MGPILQSVRGRPYGRAPHVEVVSLPIEGAQGAEQPWLAQLNSEQRAAAIHDGGPLLILAGAGSGKTRVLTHRIAYLIRDLAVPASAILAVTFTNKAAKEMRERLDRLVGKERLAELTVGTFHGFCARMLRHDAPIVGLDRGFAIYDEADQRHLLRQAMSEQGVSEKLFAPGAKTFSLALVSAIAWRSTARWSASS